MLGLSYGFPSAFLLFCHFLLKANPASIIASDDPTVPTPTAVSFSPTGALNRWAIIFTHRFCRIRIKIRNINVIIFKNAGVH
jgi:hypothetical protein